MGSPFLMLCVLRFGDSRESICPEQKQYSLGPGQLLSLAEKSRIEYM